MRNFARIRDRCDRIIQAITGPTEIKTPEPRKWEPGRETHGRAIVCVGGETGSGEVMRGDVLIVDYDEIDADPHGYGGDTLAELVRIHANEALVREVREAILTAEGIDPESMSEQEIEDAR